MSSDSHSHASCSDAMSLTREPPSGSVPTLGSSLRQHTTEKLPSGIVSFQADETRLVPEAPIVPRFSDVPLDLRELYGPIYDAPCGVPDTNSTPPPTARALRALRRDIFRKNHECSLPLSTIPQRTQQARQELRALAPHSDRLTVSSTDLSLTFQPSTQHFVCLLYTSDAADD